MYEWVGVFVAFSGVLVSNFSNFIEGDSAEDPTMAADMSKVPIHLQMVGFFLCILAAASEVGVIINRIKTRKYVPLLQVRLLFLPSPSSEVILTITFFFS